MSMNGGWSVKNDGKDYTIEKIPRLAKWEGRGYRNWYNNERSHRGTNCRPISCTDVALGSLLYTKR